MAFYRWQNGDLLLFCHLQPKAANDSFAGLHGERIKIRIKAPPVDGKANAHLLKFLAAQFGVAPAHVSLQSGEGSRQKTVLIRAPRQLPAELAITPP
jgi:uncharacterized protein (TIGR00251 family)